MKRGNFTTMAILSGALVLPSLADKVQIEQLPPQVQQKIRAQIGSARIEDIDRDVRNGQTTYEVAYKDNGQNVELKFDENGNLANAPAEAALDSRKINYNELPVPVRRVADTYVKDGEVNDVDRQVKNGRTTYAIGFKGPNGTGPQRELVLDENGRVLRGRNAGTAAASTASNPVTTTTALPNNPATAMSYSELPQPVRKSAEAHLNHGAVDRVLRQSQNGQMDYTIGFQNNDGHYQQMVIAEDGRILSNQLFQNAAAAGSPGVVQSGTSSSIPNAQPSPYAYITSPIQLQNSTVIDRGQLPVNVWRTVRRQVGTGNTISQVLRGNWSGKDVYQVTFQDTNQRYVELQLDSAGQIIYDPRGASSTSTTGNILNNLGRALFDGQK